MIDWDTRAPVDEDRVVDAEAAHGNRVLDRLRALRDAREQGWTDVAQPVMFVAIGVCLALIAGALATIVVVGPQTLVRSGSPRGIDGAAVTVTQVAAAPADVVQPILAAEPPAATALPTLGPTAASTSAPASVPTLGPTSVPTAGPTSVPTAVPTSVQTRPLTADDAWPATLLALAPIWSTDLPRTTALLDAFLARFPDYPPAVDKQYAALVAYGEKLATAGNLDEATTQLTRARDLDPERVEAPGALRALAQPAPEAASAESDAADEATWLPRPLMSRPPPPPAAPQPRAAAPTSVPRAAAPAGATARATTAHADQGPIPSAQRIVN